MALSFLVIVLAAIAAAGLVVATVWAWWKKEGLPAATQLPQSPQTSSQQSPLNTQSPQKSRYVQQRFAKPPEPCGWYGCMRHPKTGAQVQTRPISNGKPWVDVAGYSEDNWHKWPKDVSGQYWNPYAITGREEDGGIITEEVGDMPVVDPPKNRRNGPYWMQATWQTGPTDIAKLYKEKCAKRVKTRGRLYYLGPRKGVSKEVVVPGAYVWIANNPSGWTHFIPEPLVRMAGEARYRDEDALNLMKQGAELPPWNRRGPHVAAGAIRQFCK